MTVRWLGHSIGPQHPLFFMAGPDIIESEDMVLRHAERVKTLFDKHQTPFVFKCSFDKANRTSLSSFRGPGIDEGLRILQRTKERTGVSILTDVHEISQVSAVAQVADVIQIPAFLSRQTDLLVAVAKTGRAINLKKGQFVAPADIRHGVQKCAESGNTNVVVTERGYTFGYNNLIVDMRTFPILRTLGIASCIDGTHSVQLPSAAAGQSGGERQFVETLVLAAVAAGADAIFTEVHENPDQALCDGPCSLTFAMLESVVVRAKAIRAIVGSGT